MLIKEKKPKYIRAFWDRLLSVMRVSIQAGSDQAIGTVVVKQEAEGALLFIESGKWISPPNEGMTFSNVLRWTLHGSSGLIQLEHLRQGANQPVFLFYLTPTGPHSLQSTNDHVCGNDCYSGKIEWTPEHIQFEWKITGPKKNLVLQQQYH